MTQTMLVASYGTNGTFLDPRLLQSGQSPWNEPRSRRALAKTGFVQHLVDELLLSSEEVGLTTRVEGLLHTLLEQGVRLSYPASIRRYLLEHPDMINLLAVAGKAAGDRFRGRAQLSLDLYQDPEVEDSYLTLYVRQDPYDADILDQIEDVSRLFDAELATLSGWLLITTDFGAPR